VETFTLNYGAAARPLWYTEWPIFKNLMLDAAVGVLLIFASVWLESAGLRIELRRPRLRPIAKRPAAGAKWRQETKKCDIEWREAT
jgi:hypothetical protein